MNLHTHTNYCDGLADPVDYIQTAIQYGWKYIGFSAHAPLPIPSEWAMKEDDLKNYIREITQLKRLYTGKINVLLGWELDFLHSKGLYALELEELKQADYFVCSIHYLPILMTNGKVIEYVEIDGTLEEFNRIYNYYNKNLKEVLDLYLLSLSNMLEIEFPQKRIIGHIDKIVINAEKYPEFKLLKMYFYESLLKILNEHPVESYIIEINTRGIYNKNRPNPYPSFDFLEKVNNQNFQFMINSDAHHPCELAEGYNHVNRFIISNNIHLNWVEI